MPASNPATDAGKIAARLETLGTVFVACLCADWCGTCREYRDGFNRLADARPHTCFVSIDLEYHAGRFDDVDVENFPTIMIQDPDATQFFGTVHPQASIAERMFAELTMLTPRSYAWLLPKVSQPESEYEQTCYERRLSLLLTHRGSCVDERP